MRLQCEFCDEYSTDERSVSQSTLDAMQNAMENAVRLEGLEYAEVCVLLTTEEEIQRLNAEFRDIDRVTDVLSFPELDIKQPISELAAEGCEVDIESGFLGDIAICVKRAEEQAAEYGNTLEEELCFLCVHGVLHLMGYDHIDKDDELKMRARQREALGRV